MCLAKMDLTEFGKAPHPEGKRFGWFGRGTGWVNVADGHNRAIAACLIA